MFTINIIVAVCLLIGGAITNRAAMKYAPRAGRSFLVPFGMAGLLLLSALVMTALVLIEAHSLGDW